MRRHTSRQPSGPVVSARPMPARSARMKKSSSMAVLSRSRMRMIMPGMIVIVRMCTSMIMIMIMIMVVVAVARMAMIGNAAIAMHHAPIRQMRVVVLMIIKGKPASGSAKQAAIILALADNGRRAATADMAVKADDRISACHHHVQVM